MRHIIDLDLQGGGEELYTTLYLPCDIVVNVIEAEDEKAFIYSEDNDSWIEISEDTFIQGGEHRIKSKSEFVHLEFELEASVIFDVYTKMMRNLKNPDITIDLQKTPDNNLQRKINSLQKQLEHAENHIKMLEEREKNLKYLYH